MLVVDNLDHVVLVDSFDRAMRVDGTVDRVRQFAALVVGS